MACSPQLWAGPDRLVADERLVVRLAVADHLLLVPGTAFLVFGFGFWLSGFDL